MRLKEDKNNWNASNIIRKEATPPDRPRVHSRKNTAKWCKGRVGTEHQFSGWHDHGLIIGSRKLPLWEATCEVCGKRKLSTKLQP